MVSEILPHACSLECVCPLPPRRAMCLLWNTRRDADLCASVMSPTHNRLLDLSMEIATALGTVCVSRQRTVSSLSHSGSLKALRLVRGVLTAIADGCAIGCRCVVKGGSRMAVRDDSATTRCRRSCTRAANSGSADACPHATSRCDEPTADQRQAGSS